MEVELALVLQLALEVELALDLFRVLTEVVGELALVEVGEFQLCVEVVGELAFLLLQVLVFLVFLEDT